MVDLQGEHLVEVAKNQRMLLFCILGQIALQLVPRAMVVSPWLLLAAFVVVNGASIIFTVWLALRLFGTAGAALAGIAMVSPVVASFASRDLAQVLSLVVLGVLLVVNGAATRAIKALGVRVGLMGADPREVAARVARG